MARKKLFSVAFVWKNENEKGKVKEATEAHTVSDIPVANIKGGPSRPKFGILTNVHYACNIGDDRPVDSFASILKILQTCGSY
jgi:hypothetical protein